MNSSPQTAHRIDGPTAAGKSTCALAMTRVSRCQPQVWSVARQIPATGAGVVLELGLLRRRDRDAVKVRLEAAGCAASPHFVGADSAVRRQRVLRRNARKGPTHSFGVTPNMFEAGQARFERPSEGEIAHANFVRGPL